MIGYGNSMFLATHGILARGASGAPVDPDAQAFITAAAITDPTQQTAINTLVVDLKGYNIWTKMKALYPFVGGTASTHKFNLKDPRDLNAAFRLVFNGGWTHSSTGATPNGTNGYADTFLIPNTSLANSSGHLSVYSRTNISGFFYDMGAASGAGTAENSVISRWTDNKFYSQYGTPTYPNTANTDSRGLFITNRNSATNTTGYKNGSKVIDTAQTSSQLSQTNVYLGATNAFGSSTNYSPRNYAFASIGDGLTDTEAANFYTAVQAFQTAIGRSIGTQTVSDADAQAFVTNAGIVDQVEANAINNLVIGLKSDNLWTKMKAVYPFVGGSATTHKWNLKDPRDLDAAFRLVFAGDVIHSSNGALFNSVTANGFADTKLASNGTLAQNSTHFSAYSRTNNASGGYIMANGSASASGEAKMFTRWFDNNCYSGVNTFGQVPTANSDSRGYFIANRISATQHSVVIRGTKIDFNTNSSGLNTNTFRICSALNVSYDNKQIAFTSIGDGLTATELSNLNTAVVAFQTTLSRNV